jgi:hypothetical protein
MHENNNSKWSGEYLYVSTYLNGLSKLKNISLAISINGGLDGGDKTSDEGFSLM